jgi:hypothetical protein
VIGGYGISLISCWVVVRIAEDDEIGDRSPVVVTDHNQVSVWTDALCSCEEIDWFHNTHEAFIDGYREGTDDFDEEIGEDNIFLNALSLARGQDTILLDTRRVSAEGEYEAYLFAVKYGDLREPCTSFNEVIAKGRAQIEYVRSRG